MLANALTIQPYNKVLPIFQYELRHFSSDSYPKQDILSVQLAIQFHTFHVSLVWQLYSVIKVEIPP